MFILCVECKYLRVHPPPPQKKETTYPKNIHDKANFQSFSIFLQVHAVY